MASIFDTFTAMDCFLCSGRAAATLYNCQHFHQLFFKWRSSMLMRPFLWIILWVYFAIFPFFYTSKLVFMIQNWIHRSACYLRPKTQQRLNTSHFPPTDPAIWLHFQSIHRILAMFPSSYQAFFYLSQHNPPLVSVLSKAWCPTYVFYYPLLSEVGS